MVSYLKSLFTMLVLRECSFLPSSLPSWLMKLWLDPLHPHHLAPCSHQETSEFPPAECVQNRTRLPTHLIFTGASLIPGDTISDMKCLLQIYSLICMMNPIGLLFFDNFFILSFYFPSQGSLSCIDWNLVNRPCKGCAVQGQGSGVCFFTHLCILTIHFLPSEILHSVCLALK